jgi:alpha-mannosidase
LKWLLKNSPHDSICGCSIDEVHEEMKTRYDWAEQIGEEVYKNSFIYLTDLILLNSDYDSRRVLIVFNPLPWERLDIVDFIAISKKTKGEKLPFNLKLIDSDNTEIEYQYCTVEEQPRYTRKQGISHKISFLANIPALGYKVYYLLPTESEKLFDLRNDEFKITNNFLENEFYRVEIKPNGYITVIDKETDVVYDNICEFEDVGDWGDEYDFSGPKENQIDIKFTTEDAALFEKSVFIDGPTVKTLKLRLNLRLPHSLSEDRYNREDWLVDNRLVIYLSLYRDIKRIDFKIEYENNSRDHRIRVLFPTKIKSEVVYADGHFYVVTRRTELPNTDNWVQKALPTNHQKEFVSVSDNSSTFAVLNKGLPEYEAITNEDKTITLAITLLRCVEWLSRDDFLTRKSHAGPGFKTPGAQCLGKHTFELSVSTESKSSWLDSNIHLRGKEFNNPLKLIFPTMAQSGIRTSNRVILNPTGVISYEAGSKKKTNESYLPSCLSFLEISNNKIALSALKKAEEGKDIILRVFNISSEPQNTRLTFYEKILIKNIEIVNLLEEKPKNEIKANINDYYQNIIEIKLEPHVITTLKITFELIV